MMPYLSVVIPAYNEAARIGDTLQATLAYLNDQPFTWEILVVLDGSRDGTLEVVKSFAAGEKRLRWIDRAENMGKGYTVRQGLLAAQGEIRLFTDADNATDITHFERMKPKLAEGYDVVICSRDSKDVPGARQAVPQSRLKRILGDAGNLLIQFVAVPGIWDTQCGFKAFTAPAAKAIFGVAQINRWGFDIEALALARHFGYRIAIVPAYWVDKAGTHVRPSDYLKTLVDTFRTRWNLLTGVYKRQRMAVADEVGQ